MLVPATIGISAFKRGRLFAIAFFFLTTILFIIDEVAKTGFEPLNRYCDSVLNIFELKPDGNSAILLITMAGGSAVLIVISTVIFKSMFPVRK
jgi:hypothetical protein